MNRAAVLVSWLLPAVALAFALLALAGSLVSYGWLVGVAARFSNGGGADAVSLGQFESIILRLRLASAVAVPLLLALVAGRRWVAGALAAYFGHLRPAPPSPLGLVAFWRNEPLAALVLVGITGFGMGVAGWFLAQPMRYDEAWTFTSFVRMPAYLIPLRYNVPNNHVLNTLLIKLATTLLGDEPQVIRLPAYLYGALLAPAGFFLTRRLFGSGAGLLAAALVATASPLVEFSTNARGYTAICFYFLVMLSAGHVAVERRSPAGWTVAVAAGALGAYTIPVMAIPAAIAFLWFAGLATTAASDRAARLREVIGAGLALAVVVALLYAPIVAVNGPSALTANEGMKPDARVGELVLQLPGFSASVWSIWTRDYPPVLAWGLSLCALVFPLGPGRRQGVLLLGAALAVVVLYMLAVADLGYFRVWLFLLPLFLCFSAAGLAVALRQPGPRLAAGLSVALALVLGADVLSRGSVKASTETGIFPAAREVVEDLSRHLSSGDMVASDRNAAAPLIYYAARRGLDLRPAETRDDVRYFVHGGAAAPGRRLFLVVNPSPSCRPAEVLASAIGRAGMVAGGLEPFVQEDGYSLLAAPLR
ncbi:MAG TPA: glycosyltransferase family 39 protein [Magnetospirillum sp.]|jgi:hypothetical protein|nr:glycosyltransferase family 39 protein [Magnetospirillum sp.]